MFVPFYINYNKKVIISLLIEWDELIHFAFTKSFFEKDAVLCNIVVLLASK